MVSAEPVSSLSALDTPGLFSNSWRRSGAVNAPRARSCRMLAAVSSTPSLEER